MDEEKRKIEKNYEQIRWRRTCVKPRVPVMLRRHCAVAVDKLPVCLSLVTKQYNLVMVKGR